MLKEWAMLTLILSLVNTCLAQENGIIKGNIQENGGPIEFATVTLALLPDSISILNFTTTDSMGNFFFNNLAWGAYKLEITLLGYKTVTQIVNLSVNTSPYVLKDLTCEIETSNLDQIVVTARKQLIEKTTEGFTINAAANLAQIGGTATDLLKSAPTLSVNADGVILLRGKPPLILVNGRNSNLSNPDQIVASSIEKIEIITNGSAKYDANAESGVINILLKKNGQKGTNGAVALGGGAGSRGRVNSSVLFNHKTAKWNFGIGYDNRFAGRTKHITNDRINLNEIDYYLIDQDRMDERVERLQNLKFNIDFTPNERNTFSLEAIGNEEGQDNDENLTSLIYRKDAVFNAANDRRSLEYRRAKVGEFAFHYIREYDDSRKNLSAGFSSSLERGRENTDITTLDLLENLTSFGDPFLQKTHNYEDGVISNAVIDYSVPVSQFGILETGYKGIFRSIKTDFEASTKIGNNYEVDPIASNLFTFHEQVHSFYALLHSTLDKTLGAKWKYELGLRIEQVHNSGDAGNLNADFENHYLKFFPNGNLVFLPGENQYWKLSYGRKINRPRLGQLNPFIDITDALNPHSGNPDLDPEIIDAIELGYNIESANWDFSANVFYRHATNTIRSVFQQLPGGVVLNSPMNIGNSDSYGVENILIAKLSRFYDFNASIALFQQELDGSNVISDAVQSSFNWNGKVINNLTMGKFGKFQLIGNYNSSATTPQGRLIPIYYADLGYQHKIGEGDARIGLIVVDLFNTLKSGYHNITSEFTFSRTQKADTRAVMLSFAYLFKSAFKEELLKNQFSREF